MAKLTLGPRARALWTALILALTIITIPRHPVTLDDSFSERAVLSYAHQHGFQFGKDIIFTYGPLGFLTSRSFFSHAAGLRTVVDALLAFTVSAGLCLLAWRLSIGWRVSLLCLFIFLSTNIDPRADLLIYVGLLCWGLLCLLETSPALAWCASSFVILSTFAMLEKVSFFFIAGVSIAAIASDLVIRGNFRLGLGIGCGLGAGIILGWIVAGQELVNLPAFILNAITVIQGYGQSVGLEGLQTLRWRGLLLAVLAVIPAIIRGTTAFHHENKHTPLRRGILLTWVFSLIFMIWKHSFVRTDVYHVGFVFGFAPILVLALETLPTAHLTARSWARGFALVCCCLAILTLQSLFFPDLKSSLTEPFRALAENILTLARPAAYRAEMNSSLEAARRDAQLPRLRQIIGRSTVDVFGQQQAYALFNDLNYHPRPLFQSYMAYNAPLMRLNEQFYASKAAPEYVLFDLGPIDHKFPPLEDAMALRYLLTNYELAASEGPFLLLKSSASSPPRSTLVREGSVHPGEPISFKGFEDVNIWIEVRLKPTLLGRARQLFYKPPPVRLTISREGSSAKPARFRAPAPMMAAGFMASPLLARREDVLNLYTGKTLIRPDGYSVELDRGSDAFWQPVITYRFYKIENPIGIVTLGTAASAGRSAVPPSPTP